MQQMTGWNNVWLVLTWCQLLVIGPPERTLSEAKISSGWKGKWTECLTVKITLRRMLCHVGVLFLNLCGNTEFSWHYKLMDDSLAWDLWFMSIRFDRMWFLPHFCKLEKPAIHLGALAEKQQQGRSGKYYIFLLSWLLDFREVRGG